MPTPSQQSHHSAASFPVHEHEVASDSSARTSNSDWPTPFVFPTKNLPTYVQNALDKQINLCNPKQRHLRGLLLQTLCSEAVKFKTHPDHHEKLDMAKSIVVAFPHLKEPVGRGYDGWLASVVDCLKSTRRHLGVIDQRRSEAIRKRRLNVAESNDDNLNATHSGSGPVLHDQVRMCEPEHAAPRSRYKLKKKKHLLAEARSVGSPISSVPDALPSLNQRSVAPAMTATVTSKAPDKDVVASQSPAMNATVTSKEPDKDLMASQSPAITATVTSKEPDKDLVASQSPAASMKMNLVQHMKDEWRKPVSDRNRGLLLLLLRQTFEERRALMYTSHNLKTTKALKDSYPALFFRDGIFQEYQLIQKTTVSIEHACTNAVNVGNIILNTVLSEFSMEGRRAKSRQRHLIDTVVAKLNLALQDYDDEESQNRYRATAGLMLLPLLLGETASYFYVEYEASSSQKTNVHVYSPHVVLYYPFERESKAVIHIDGVASFTAMSCLDAFVLVFATYYSLWLQLPKAAECSYKFLGLKVFQQALLQEKLPAKLIRLISKLA